MSANPVTFRNSLIEPFLNLGKPVIAAVNGYCLGGGMEVLYACTLAYAAEGARFAQPEVNLGFNPLAGATEQLPLLVGRKKTMEVLLLGEMFDAAEALRLGIINEVVPASTLMERVREVATRLAAKPRLAVRYIMDCVWQAGYLTLEQGLDLEAKCYAICCTSPDVIQNLAVFLRNARRGRKPEGDGCNSGKGSNPGKEEVYMNQQQAKPVCTRESFPEGNKHLKFSQKC